MKTVAIIHYNTPEMTEATILSVRKHGGEGYAIYILDNSDKRPFTKRMKGVKVLDNTKGQIIDFDKELEKYPERDRLYGCAKGCEFGSDKHIMSVQKLWELLPDGFLLMDSDILLKANVDFMWMEGECAVGHVSQGSGLIPRERLAPMLLYINVPLCKERGAVFFDPDRSWALHQGEDERNFWDTGAALLADIRSHKNGLCGKQIDIRPLMEHYGSGSWEGNDLDKQRHWLTVHKDLWYSPPRKRYTVLTYIFNDYEAVHEIKQKDEEAEYILVTDDPNLKSQTWQVVCDRSLAGLSPFMKCYKVRFNPFKYASTDIVVRIDGSIEMRKPLTDIIDAFDEGEYDRCLMIHPTRNTLPEEYEVWVKTRDYSIKQAAQCLTSMQRLGYDMKTKGLYQGCFEIQQRNEVNERLNHFVYDLLMFFGNGDIERINQTVTSFALNSLYFDILKVLPVSERLVTDGDRMQWYLHHSMTPIDNPITIEPYLFNKKCQPWNEGKPTAAKRGKRK